MQDDGMGPMDGYIHVAGQARCLSSEALGEK